MSSPIPRQHAGPPAQEQPSVPEPSHADRARTMVHLGRLGTLSTHSRKLQGFPFGSIMPYSPDAQGRPVFLISSMAMHTQNLAADRRASLLVTQIEAGGDPLGSSRVTLLGEITPVPEDELPAVRERYLAHYENARHWVDFRDFSFFRLEPADVYFVGGFGVMGWVTAENYRNSEPDPLSDAASGILSHMNADHAEALLLLARAFASAEAQAASMTSVDRLGFFLRLTQADRIFGVRIGFLREVRSAAEARAVLVEMVHRAREA